MTEDAIIDALFQRLRRDAVLLHRPYPPHLAADTNSKFGGLPTLPENYPWPRMNDGKPLHFLAQIDCSALPFASELPDNGILFFFALESDEQVWDEEYLGDKGYRVVHIPDVTGKEPLRAPPDDLPPIGQFYPPSNQRPFLREGEAGSNLHVEWPIELRQIESWPDASALTEADLDLPDNRDWLQRRFSRLPWKRRRAIAQADKDARLREAYHEKLEGLRLSAFKAASAYTLSEGKPEGERSPGNTKLAEPILAQEGEYVWPEGWVTIGYFCRAMRRELERLSDNHKPKGVEAHLATAESWIASADAGGDTEPVSEADRKALRDWMDSLMQAKVAAQPEKEAVVLRYGVVDCVVLACVATIRNFAHDRASAELISPVVYTALASHFQGNGTFGLKFSQMLGYAPSSQQARMTNDPAFCLLSLASDQGLGWMFGDVGEATFYIFPEALEARAFDRVEASVEGH